MNSKLPPKYTILFLLLFISISNKGETALRSAELYPAQEAYMGKAYPISTHTSSFSGNHFTMAISDLESYQWYIDIEHYI